MNKEIAEDIQMLANFWLDIRTYTDEENQQMIKAAQRVEVYLSTFKPDSL